MLIRLLATAPRQHGDPSPHPSSPILYSLVSPAHIPEVEATASAVAKHHDTHAMGDSVTSQALKPAAGKGRQKLGGEVQGQGGSPERWRP